MLLRDLCPFSAISALRRLAPDRAIELLR